MVANVASEDFILLYYELLEKSSILEGGLSDPNPQMADMKKCVISYNYFNPSYQSHICSLDVSVPLYFAKWWINAWKPYVPLCSTEDTFTFLLQYMKNAPHNKT